MTFTFTKYFIVYTLKASLLKPQGLKLIYLVCSIVGQFFHEKESDRDPVVKNESNYIAGSMDFADLLSENLQNNLEGTFTSMYI